MRRNCSYLPPVFSILLVFSMLCARSFAQSCTGSSCTAASCSESAVLAALPSSSNTNSTVTVNIPACSGTWTTSLKYAQPSSVTTLNILGSGTPNSGSGTTGASASCTATYLMDNAGSSQPMFNISTTYPQTFKIGCMAIDPNSTSTVLVDPIWIVGTCTSSGCPSVRVHNITFGFNIYWSIKGNSVNAEAGMLVENSFGVIDHNSIGSSSLRANNFELFNSEHGQYLGVGQYGDNSWAQPDSLGGANNLFAENNLKYDSGYLPMNDSEQDDVFTNRGGTRVVMRYNLMHQGSGNAGGYGLFQDHGADSGGRARGAREAEVYNNTIYCESSSTNCSGVDGGLRSGTGLFFGNQANFTLGNNGPWVSLSLYRNVTASWLPFAACGGSGPWDQNDGTAYYSGSVSSVSNGALTMTDSSQSFGNLVPAGNPYSVYDVTQGWWSEVASNTSTTITVRASVGYGAVNFVAGDSYQVLRATSCIDQPARGQGKYMSGSSTSCSVAGASVAPAYTGPSACGYSSQALDPIYRWNEATTGGATSGGVVPNGTSRFIAYRDFYDSAPGIQASSSSPFSCNGSTGGTGWGTLANRPASCSGACTTNSPGCGYFATDQGSQGTLYTWQGGAWATYYQPYTYPHPLESDSSGSAPPAATPPPSGLTAIVN
jgi:hypothetical protein